MRVEPLAKRDQISKLRRGGTGPLFNEVRRVERLEYRSRGNRDARIDQHEPEVRQRLQSLDQFALAPHQRRFCVETDRHIRTETEAEGGERVRLHFAPVQATEQAQGRRRIGRAAADAGGNGQVFFQRHMRFGFHTEIIVKAADRL